MATVTSFPRREPEAVFEQGNLGPAQGDGGFDLRRLFGAIRRRKILIAGLMIVATGVAAVYANQLQPLYSAETRIVIESARNKVINIERVAQGITPDYYTMETEAAVIGSRAIAAKVVDRLNLYENPLYNPALMDVRPSLWRALVDRARQFVGFGAPDAGAVRAKDPWAGMPPAEKRTAMREYLADAFIGGLAVLPSQTSRLISISYVSTNPEMAARAANATAEAYILDQIESKGDVTARASRWLNERVVELRDRVIESETKLEQFRAKAGLIDFGQGSTLKTQLSKLETELSQARTLRAEAEARYQQVQKLLKDKSVEGGVDSAAAVLDSPLIQRLREQETNIVRQLSVLQTQLREGHPQMVLAKNELADLRKKIEVEVGKIVRNLDNELEISRVREANLKRESALLERQIEDQGQASATMRALLAEVDANKQLYQTVLARFKETKVVDDEVQQADARIISPAVAPGGPFYPQKKLIIVAALFVSALFGIAIAIGLEMLDSGFRSLSHVESFTGIPALGVIPLLGKQDSNALPHEIAVRSPNSPFGEAIRSIRTGLMLSNIDAPPRTVLVTSSVSSEGKTTTALSIAALSARTGQRSIIVDCDLRHPSVHVALDVPNQSGLSNYLTGQVLLEEVVDIDLNSGVHYITAGGRSPHPTDLLGSQQMKALIALLSQQYDLVVLDTPPLLAVSDTLVLARQVEKTIFVVRWEKTRRETVLSGLRQIVDAGADIAGVVMTQVDMKKQARYGQSDNGYQYYYDRHMNITPSERRRVRLFRSGGPLMQPLFSALRRFGHQHWIPHGRDRVLRLFANPDREIDFPFEVDFFGLRYIGNLNNFIDWSVYFYGAFAHDELFLMRDIAASQRGAGGPVTVYDIGANIGHHSLYMSPLADRVIAFEPFAAVREKFEVKLAANAVGNVTVFPFALGDRNGAVPFYPPTGVNAGTGSLVATAGIDPVTVEIRRGDEVVRDEALPPPTLMKVDVEGAEADVFAGLRGTVLGARPFILMELLDDTRARVGDEAGLRRLFYPDADLFHVGPHPGRRDYRLRPFDFARSLEMLIAPRGAAQAIPALAARMGEG